MPAHTAEEYTSEDIVAFWFPDGDAPTADEHMRLWNWRMRGGAYEEVLTRFSDLTARAAAGDLDHWADTPMGRLASGGYAQELPSPFRAPRDLPSNVRFWRVPVVSARIAA